VVIFFRFRGLSSHLAAASANAKSPIWTLRQLSR